MLSVSNSLDVGESASSQQSKKTDINKRPKFFLVKYMIYEWCQTTSTHGLRSITATESTFLRIVWIIAFLAALSYCVYSIVLSVLNFLEWPVSINLQIIDELPTQFPAIMLCGLNPFNTSSPQFQVDPNPNQNPSSINNYKLDPFSYYYQESENAKFSVYKHDNDSQRQVYGNRLDQMLVYCAFGAKDCTAQGVYDYNYVNCYSFNSNGSLSIGRIGPDNGLKLELYVPNNRDSYTYNRGFRFIVYNYSIDKPFIYDQGFDANVGQVTSVQVSKNLYDRLSSPYSSCLSDLSSSNPSKTGMMSTMFNSLNQLKYSQVYCQNLCLQTVLLANCSCIDPNFPNLPLTNKPKPCSFEPTQAVCQSSIKTQFNADPNKYCGDECPRECDYSSYDLTISTSQYLTNWYWNYSKSYYAYYASKPGESNSLNSNLASLDLSGARSSLLRINIYLANVGYKLISEAPLYTFDSFLAILGGQLGLFVGCSLLSLVELFELVYMIGYELISFGFRNMKTKQVHSRV